MTKYTFWISTGFAGCNYEETIELPEDTTEDTLKEYMNNYLINHIDYGYFEV